MKFDYFLLFTVFVILTICRIQFQNCETFQNQRLFWTSLISDCKKAQVVEVTAKPSIRLDTNLFDIKQDKRPFDVTFVSQSSLNRWGFMKQIAEFWKGPMSIAFYFPISELPTFNQLLQNTTLRPNIILDYVIQTNLSLYPLNSLRNKAIDNCRTSHFYLSDMDVWPAPSTYDAILSLPKYVLEDEYEAIIVPAFQIYIKSCTSFEECELLYRDQFPTSKQLLRQCITNKRCNTFRPNEWLHDYYSFDWFYSQRDLIPVTCLKSDTQEPYVVVKRSSHLPRFNESFTNYAYDKVQWLEHLRYIGYKYSILGNGYCVDIPHPPSSFRKEFFKIIKETKIFPMFDVYNDFLDYLNQTQTKNIVVPLCKGARRNPRRIWFTSDVLKLKRGKKKH